jgi:4-hydroxy-3-methylbut-2-enyl diphosphate reductase
MSFTVLLAAPRGFCAGVERAIRTVELALDNRAAGDERPVYVRHEIVHNKVVVDDLRARGAVFVEDTREIPVGATAVFSAHGISPVVRAEAAARDLVTLDATCPLVSRVHAAVLRYAARGYTILFVGHAGHPEVEGVMGEAPQQVRLVQTVADVEHIEVPDPSKVAYCTQTTLSLDDVSAIVEALRRRFPAMVGPEASDVCYATQNRQEAVQALVRQHKADVVLVLGSPNSSNSNRLREVAETDGARAYLLGTAAELDPTWLAGAQRVGVSAGASTPEHLVETLIDRLKALGASDVQTVETSVEDVFFAPPPMRGAEGAALPITVDSLHDDGQNGRDSHPRR